MCARREEESPDSNGVKRKKSLLRTETLSVQQGDCPTGRADAKLVVMSVFLTQGERRVLSQAREREMAPADLLIGWGKRGLMMHLQVGWGIKGLRPGEDWPTYLS